MNDSLLNEEMSTKTYIMLCLNHLPPFPQARWLTVHLKLWSSTRRIVSSHSLQYLCCFLTQATMVFLWAERSLMYICWLTIITMPGSMAMSILLVYIWRCRWILGQLFSQYHEVNRSLITVIFYLVSQPVTQWMLLDYFRAVLHSLVLKIWALWCSRNAPALPGSLKSRSRDPRCNQT